MAWLKVKLGFISLEFVETILGEEFWLLDSFFFISYLGLNSHKQITILLEYFKELFSYIN